MLPFMHVPGRIALCLGASILLNGFVARHLLGLVRVSSPQDDHRVKLSTMVEVVIPDTIPKVPLRLRNTKSSFDDTAESVARADILSTAEQSQDPPRVNLLLCVEALCIDSRKFVMEELIPTYSLLGSNVIDLRVVVYGNARMNVENRTITCQHGVAECDANAHEQCAISLYPYADRYLPYLQCLFEQLPMGRRSEVFEPAIFAACARQSALDWSVLAACHDDEDQSWWLQREAADRTPSYHDHVPWVEINGKFMNEDTQDLLPAVCKAYVQSGGKHPSCPSPSLLEEMAADRT